MRTYVQNSIAIIYAILKVAELSGLQLPILAILAWALPISGDAHVSLVDAFVIMHLVCMVEHWADGYDTKKKG